LQADDIRHLRTASAEYGKTERLKGQLQSVRASRDPFLLTSDELDLIFRWKLRGQYERTQRRRAMNTPAVYEAVTEAVFKVVDPSPDYEATVRLGLLTALPGIGVPVASAVLALADPQRYCVIDFRGWRAVFRSARTVFLVPEYLRYRTEVAKLASQLGWTVQETDLAIWEYDRRQEHGVA